MGKILNTSSLSAKYILPDMSEREISVKSNTTSTENMTTSFEKVRSTAQNYGVPNEKVTQTLTLTNNSEYELSNIQIRDDISLGATFSDGSLSIGGVQQPQLNPVNGFTLTSNIGAGSQVVITYDIQIDSMPASDIVNVLSNITYTVDGREILTEKSNIVELQIVSAGVEITKSASKRAVVSGDVISFVNVVRNVGNVKVENIIFTDDIPEGATFVAESVVIDDNDQPTADPAKGIMLNDLEAGDETTISFEVMVS